MGGYAIFCRNRDSCAGVALEHREWNSRKKATDENTCVIEAICYVSFFVVLRVRISLLLRLRKHNLQS